MTTTPRQKYRTQEDVLRAKIAVVRAIIATSKAPITAREISRRIMGRDESPIYHLTSPEVSAIVRIHLASEVTIGKMYQSGALKQVYTISQKVPVVLV